MNPLEWVFNDNFFFSWISSVFQMVFDFLSWDIIKGGLAFTLGLGIALYAVMRIKNAFGGV